MMKHINRLFCNAFSICVLLLIIGCTPLTQNEAALYKFIDEFETEMKEEYGFRVFGCGGSLPVKIEEINISFNTGRVEDVDSARRLAVPIALKMIDRMNESEYLRPCLLSYPATIKNILFTLIFKKTDRLDIPESVTIIGARDKVLYHIYNESRTMLIDLHRETFDEALRILELEEP